MSKFLPFTRYVWCLSCNTFDAHTLRADHEKAMSSLCPHCGSNDICSKPPEHHQKQLAKLARAAA